MMLLRESGLHTAVSPSRQLDAMDDHSKDAPKGILKHSGDHAHHKEMKWDEMNIIATHHPADKDYGHMKIDEAKTPYHQFTETGEEKMDVSDVGSKGQSALDPAVLSDRLAHADDTDPKASSHPARRASFSAADEVQSELALVDDDEDVARSMSPEDRAKHEEFKLHRRMHYNEGQRLIEAKKLLDQEGFDEDDQTELNTELNAELKSEEPAEERS